MTFRTLIALAASVGIATATGFPVAVAQAADGDAPWLTPLALGSRYDLTFDAFSRDGTRLFVSGPDPVTDLGPIGIWEAGTYELERLTPPDIAATFIVAAPDGSAIVFSTFSSLVPEDSDANIDLYRVKDGEVDLISVGSADHATRAWWMSNGGTRVIFDTKEAITPDDTNSNDPDWYIWEESTGAVRLMSADLETYSPIGLIDSGDRILLQDATMATYDWVDGTETYLTSGNIQHVSADGSRVYVTTRDTLLPADTDASHDTYVYGPGGIELLSPDQTADVDLPAVSDDGSAWLLQSAGPLLASDDDLKSDLYVATAGGLTLLPSGGDDSWAVDASADLSTVILRTFSSLTSADTDNGEDLYRWDASDPTAVTLLTSGTDSHVPTLKGLSPDGDTVVIETAEPLLPEGPEIGFAIDAYEWFDGTLINLAPVSNDDIAVSGVSTDGRRVALLTRGDLVHRECTTGLDLYLSDRQVEPPPVPPEDMDPPVGTITIDGGATYVDGVTVRVQAPATDAWSGVNRVALSNDSKNWTESINYNDTGWRVKPTNGTANGTATVYAKWLDNACNWSSVQSDTIIADSSAPSATAPVVTLATGSNLVSGSVTARLTWTGSDLIGIERYELAQQRDGGTWSVVSTTLTSPAAVRSLAAGHTYAFRVRAIDHVGYASAWMTGSTFRLSGYSESSTAMKYAGTWVSTTSTAYWGGRARASTSAGAKATFTFTGRSVAIISRLGPGRGRAEIWVGTTKMATIDLRSTAYSSQRVVWSKAWTTSIKRTVTIKVLGTSGRPRVEVDGFFVGS